MLDATYFEDGSGARYLSSGFSRPPSDINDRFLSQSFRQRCVKPATAIKEPIRTGIRAQDPPPASALREQGYVTEPSVGSFLGFILFISLDPDGNEMRWYQVLTSDTQVTGERQQP
jgi:hypothetical protein